MLGVYKKTSFKLGRRRVH